MPVVDTRKLKPSLSAISKRLGCGYTQGYTNAIKQDSTGLNNLIHNTIKNKASNCFIKIK